MVCSNCNLLSYLVSLLLLFCAKVVEPGSVCDQWMSCAQRCSVLAHPDTDTTKCSCDPGYVIKSDKFSCNFNHSIDKPYVSQELWDILDDQVNFLMVTVEDSKSSFSILVENLHSQHLFSISSEVEDAVPFGSDVSRTEFFYSAKDENGIRKLYRRTKDTETEIKVVVAQLYTFTVDWWDERLFIQDGYLKRLSVCDFNGINHAILLSNIDIKHLLVEPRVSLIFWSNVATDGNYTIEFLTLNCNFRKILYRSPKPVSCMTSDFEMRRLMWVHEMFSDETRIHTMTYAGRGRSHIDVTLQAPYNIKSIISFANFIFLELSSPAFRAGYSQISKINKWRPQEYNIIRDTYNRISAFELLDRRAQRKTFRDFVTVPEARCIPAGNDTSASNETAALPLLFVSAEKQRASNPRHSGSSGQDILNLVLFGIVQALTVILVTL